METLERLFSTEMLPLLSSVLLLFAATYLLNSFFAQRCLSSIPFIGLDFGNAEKRRNKFVAEGRAMLRAGYETFKKGMFRITTTDGTHIVVTKQQYLDELKQRPDSEVSFTAALDEMLEPKYTTIPSGDDLITHVVKADLTPNLTRLSPVLAEEVEHALAAELPAGDSWTPFNVNAKLLRIVAMVSGRLFIGPAHCQNEDWIRMSINYTVDAFNGRTALKKWRSWQRPFVHRFIPELKDVHVQREKARRFLVPIIKARKEAEGKEGYQKPDDMMQWLLDKAEAFGVQNFDQQAYQQLTLSMAAIHTTTLTTTHALYDLAARPEYIKSLREELRTVLGETGGKFEKTTLGRLQLLDSFMKESQRYNPIGSVSFTRKILKPITLSDGTHFPAGTTIEAPSDAISRDHERFSDPDTFDGYRFYKLRQKGGENANRHQFVTVNQNSLNFGYGRHACPGRFFASNEIKLILAGILQNYDVALTEPEAGRYKNWEFGTQIVPDPTKKLLFRKANP